MRVNPVEAHFVESEYVRLKKEILGLPSARFTESDDLDSRKLIYLAGGHWRKVLEAYFRHGDDWARKQGYPLRLLIRDMQKYFAVADNPEALSPKKQSDTSIDEYRRLYPVRKAPDWFRSSEG
jgi:hypothetical protein